MTSWVRDRLSLGSSKNSSVVNSGEVSCQIDVSYWKIPKQIIKKPDGRVLIRFSSCKEQSLSSKSLENLALPRTSYSMPSRSTSYDYSKDNQVEDTQKNLLQSSNS